MKGLFVGRVYKHPDFPELSPMSQRGHDLLELFVAWCVDKLDEVWATDVLARKVTDYFALCVQSDLKILTVHAETQLLIEDSLLECSLTYKHFERLANAIGQDARNEKHVRDVVLVAFQQWTLEQQDAVTECLLLRQDSDRRVQSFLAADWIEMTGNTQDEVGIPKRGLEFDLKYMTENQPMSPAEVREVIRKKDFFDWRLSQIGRLADVYKALDNVVLQERNVAKEYMDWKVKKHDNEKEKGVGHDA